MVTCPRSRCPRQLGARLLICSEATALRECHGPGGARGGELEENSDIHRPRRGLWGRQAVTHPDRPLSPQVRKEEMFCNGHTTDREGGRKTAPVQLSSLLRVRDCGTVPGSP